MAGTSSAFDGLRIMVLEDEYLVAVELCTFLEAEGATVVGPIGDLVEGLDRARREEHLDAAILDLNLRGHNSLPVAAELLRRSIPFLIVSGYDADVVRAEFGSAPYLNKPVGANEVLETLTAALARQDQSLAAR